MSLKVDPRFYNDDHYNTDRHVECARWNHLVYARTLKSGSEFFYRNFTQTAGWQPMTWQEIDWSRDTVFSYIMDPIQRRHKGVAEYLFITGTIDLLFDDKKFAKMIAQVPSLDEHSACMRDLYGERVHDMYWIPLSQEDHEQGQRLTDQFLNKHGHPPLAWNREFVHTTEIYIGHAYRRLRQLWEHQDIIGLARFYFQQDVEIYLKALEIHDLLEK